jgi:hypothetical protein
MVQGFESFHRLGKENVDLALRSLGNLSKGMQMIASEVADYSKRNYESSSSALDRVIRANTLDKAFEAQAEYMRAAYDEYVDEVARLGDMYASLARETFQGVAIPMVGGRERASGNVQPIEGVAAKDKK